MPGTFGSLGGVVCYLLVKDNFLIYILTMLVIFLLGFLTAGKAEVVFKEKDSGKIVIDEVAAMLLCYLFIPFTFLNLVLGFVLFRIFDIFKPYPAAQAQNLKGSLGIMLDDIIAALYTNSILHTVVFILSRMGYK